MYVEESLEGVAGCPIYMGGSGGVPEEALRRVYRAPARVLCGGFAHCGGWRLVAKGEWLTGW